MREGLQLAALTTVFGAAAGAYSAEKPHGEPTHQDCRGQDPSCAGNEFLELGQSLVEPAENHRERTAIGATIGLVSGLVLSAVATRLDRKDQGPKRI